MPEQNFSPTAIPAILTAEAPPPEGIVVRRDIAFGKGGLRDLLADIAYPERAPAPLPAVIWIHGGGWKEGTRKESPIYYLAQKGYFAASIDYRFAAEAKWPAQLEDCKLAVRWLRAKAAQYGVNPERIGVWGPSAGGHLVACLGTMGDIKEYEGDGGYPGVSSAVQAVVEYFGPTDFTVPGLSVPVLDELVRELFGVAFEQNSQLWKSGSPIAYVKPGDPPMLLVHGDSDVAVPLAQSTVFDEALSKAGVPHELLVVKNAVHGLWANPGTTTDPSPADIQKAVDAFLGKYL